VQGRTIDVSTFRGTKARDKIKLSSTCIPALPLYFLPRRWRTVFQNLLGDKPLPAAMLRRDLLSKA
jgi:hypothetical protein